MSHFETTRWADTQFGQDYRDEAQIYLPYRSNFFRIAKSYFESFVTPRIPKPKVLDLGCGDGVFMQELLQSRQVGDVVLLDGSRQMLSSAETRLSCYGNAKFIEATFQELLAPNDPLQDTYFDFVFSSLAIHHLPLPEKSAVYDYIYRHLSRGGHFLNYDVVIAPTSDLEQWSMTLWRLWIEDHPDEEVAARLLDIPEKYKANTDNIPDTLSDQLGALRSIGFEGVDCFFKYGAFALFGGMRSE